MECSHCGKILKNKYTLKTHQESAKYCLKKRDKHVIYEFKCDYCNSDFSQKIHLDRHIKCCRKKKIKFNKQNERILQLENEITMVKEERDYLRKKYDELAKTLANKPTNKTTIHNTLNLAIFDKTERDIKRIVQEKYDEKYFYDGQKGVARFTFNHITKTEEDEAPLYVITDKTRGNGKYRKGPGEIVNDNGLIGLTNKIHPSVKEKAFDYVQKKNSGSNIYEDEGAVQAFRDIKSMIYDNKPFRKEFVKLATADEN